MRQGADGEFRRADPRRRGDHATVNRADDELVYHAASGTLFDMDFSAPRPARRASRHACVKSLRLIAAGSLRSSRRLAMPPAEAKVESDRAALALEAISVAIKGIAARFSESKAG